MYIFVFCKKHRISTEPAILLLKAAESYGIIKYIFCTFFQNNGRFCGIAPKPGDYNQ